MLPTKLEQARDYRWNSSNRKQLDRLIIAEVLDLKRRMDEREPEENDVEAYAEFAKGPYVAPTSDQSQAFGDLTVSTLKATNEVAQIHTLIAEEAAKKLADGDAGDV